ncbi:hypothetical protein BJY01DRAFT_246626 [Aspergillus pseudoustus]|uniref:RRM domain-containing protein n=1 Tax=Aspergillus pseudoustus TaxID=1810923 RepID=A0ABR4K6B9_9EURO
MGKVYIGHLSSGTTSSDVENAFLHGLRPSNVIVMRDRDTSESRGFGFVTFDSAYEAQKAIDALNHTEFGGSYVNVNFANAKLAGHHQAQFQSRLGDSYISYPVSQYSGYWYRSGYGSSGGARMEAREDISMERDARTTKVWELSAHFV